MEPINFMFNYLNNHDSSDTNSKLIRYTLSNISLITHISSQQFADETFVSKATISRFIKFVGFHDFDQFRNYFNSVHNIPLSKFFHTSNFQLEAIQNEPNAFIEGYVNKIIESLQDFKETVDITEIDQLIKRIIHTNRVAIVGSFDCLNLARDIQLGFLTIHKLIDVIQNEVKWNEVIQTYDTNDLIIILSNYGNFFINEKESYQECLKKKIPLCLITQNFNSMESFYFEQAIYLTSKRNLSVGNYPMRIFSEYIVRRAIALRD